jgi:hypothetical protein
VILLTVPVLLLLLLLVTTIAVIAGLVGPPQKVHQRPTVAEG